jgi:hypothetical protein
MIYAGAACSLSKGIIDFLYIPKERPNDKIEVAGIRYRDVRGLIMESL